MPELLLKALRAAIDQHAAVELMCASDDDEDEDEDEDKVLPAADDRPVLLERLCGAGTFPPPPTATFPARR